MNDKTIEIEWVEADDHFNAEWFHVCKSIQQSVLNGSICHVSIDTAFTGNLKVETQGDGNLNFLPQDTDLHYIYKPAGIYYHEEDMDIEYTEFSDQILKRASKYRDGVYIYSLSALSKVGVTHNLGEK